MTADHPDTKTDPTKIAFLRNLPLEIKQALTKEEVNAFLHDLPWPDSLYEKLKEFIEDAE